MSSERTSSLASDSIYECELVGTQWIHDANAAIEFTDDGLVYTQDPHQILSPSSAIVVKGVYNGTRPEFTVLDTQLSIYSGTVFEMTDDKLTERPPADKKEPTMWQQHRAVDRPISTNNIRCAHTQSFS